MRGDSRLTLVEHLSELRKRLIISIIAIIAGAVICFNFIEEIIELLIRPGEGLDFIYLSPPELFVAYIKISLILGFIIALPVVLFQIWMFVQPGLKDNERKLALFVLNAGIVFFLIGVVFSYLVVIPMTINFFLEITIDNIEPLFSFNNYVGFISSIILSFGLIFELPLVVILLTQLGFVTPSFLKKSRKYVLLGVIVISAILTPPDVVSQVLMTIPMLILFELSILISSVIYRKKIKAKKEKAE